MQKVGKNIYYRVFFEAKKELKQIIKVILLKHQTAYYSTI